MKTSEFFRDGNEFTTKAFDALEREFGHRNFKIVNILLNEEDKPLVIEAKATKGGDITPIFPCKIEFTDAMEVKQIHITKETLMIEIRKEIEAKVK